MADERRRARTPCCCLSLVQLREEMLGEQLGIVLALAQRRQVDREHGQPVQQVLAQLAFADRLLRIAVGGGDDAHVGARARRRRRRA